MNNIVLSGETINKTKKRAIIRNEILNMNLNNDESLILAKCIRGVEYKKVKNDGITEDKSINSVEQALEILDDVYNNSMVSDNSLNEKLIERQNEYNKQLVQLKTNNESLIRKQEHYNTKLDKLEQDRILTNEYYEEQVKKIKECELKYSNIEKECKKNYDNIEKKYTEECINIEKKYEEEYEKFLKERDIENENLKTKYEEMESIINQQNKVIEYIQQENAKVLLFLAELLNSPV